MKERPILFSAPMVRALLAGTKTQTRRIVKARDLEWMDVHQGLREPDNAERCPYGGRGDRLWVRETFARIDGQTRPWIETDYQATYTHGDRLGDTLGIKKRWTPSIHMPRHASRITLEVTGVRVERLQDISEADAVAEGCKPIRPELVQDGLIVRPGRSAVEEFRLVWEQIHGGGSWEKNPFVWVVTFRRIDHA